MNNYGQVFLIILLIGFSALSQGNEVKDVRIWPSPESTRIVFDMTNKPEYSYFSLSNPQRIVIDLKSTQNAFNLLSIDNKGKLIKRIRHSKPKASGDSRIVIELTKKIRPLVFPLAPTSPYGDRLVIDLIDQSKTPIQTHEPKGDRDIIIAIDAGHGGEDPGSIGKKGLYEKKVTLGIAKEIVSSLNKKPGFRGVLVREGDYYIHPNKRTDIARIAKADFLISIHADAFTTPKPHGASVWVLSLKRAETEIGRWMERTEKHSQLLGGTAQVIAEGGTQDRYLARTLLDMSMDHSMLTGYDVANSVIRRMKKVTRMHKKKPQSASLAVLKSPDIPSILIEVGFISNPKEEKNLKTSWYQKKLAKAITIGVEDHFNIHAPEGTLLAKQGIKKYKIQRGDSLSVIAEKYKISVAKLKEANQLTSDKLIIGQVLMIPVL